MKLLLYTLAASLPLVAGGALGAFWQAPRWLIGHLLGFATGALVASLAFELIGPAYREGNPTVVLALLAAGAVVFVVVDALLDRAGGGKAVGFALLAGVTLDGVPENAALGVTIVSGGSIALLVGIFVSNLPESMAGSAQMRADGLSRGRCIAIWGGAAVLLAAAVVVGNAVLQGSSQAQLALPLAFAAGAVLASIVDTLAPEAFRDAGPWTALATVAGFALGVHLALGG